MANGDTSKPDPSLTRAVKKLHPALRAAFDQLRASGWRPVQSSVGRMGEVVVTLEAGSVLVRLFHERGDPTIEAGAIAWSAPYAASIWHEFLDNVEVDPRTPVAAQAAMLLAGLPAIANAIGSNGVDQDQLRAIGTRQRWAIPGWPN